MSRCFRAVAFVPVALLAAALVGGAGARAADDDKEIKKAQEMVLDLAKKAADGKDVAKEAEAVRKKFDDLNTVMHIYKPSTKGGIGTGIPPKAGDGIEIKIQNLGRGRGLDAANLKKEKEALIKLGYINAAMAEITMHYAPTKTKGGKGKKDWMQHSKEMKDASLELVKAVKAANKEMIKTAANNLNNSCTNCHSDFRD